MNTWTQVVLKIIFIFSGQGTIWIVFLLITHVFWVFTTFSFIFRNYLYIWFKLIRWKSLTFDINLRIPISLRHRLYSSRAIFLEKSLWRLFVKRFFICLRIQILFLSPFTLNWLFLILFSIWMLTGFLVLRFLHYDCLILLNS